MTYPIAEQSNITKTLVCIDRICDSEPEGRLYNPYEKAVVPFFGMFGMAKKLETLMDRFAFPQPMFRYRTFHNSRQAGQVPKDEQEVRRFMSDSVFKEEKGDKATFVVQVQFRQNATWQGTIQWLDKKKIQKFRSTLEMIKLMDEALVEEQGAMANWTEAPDDMN